MIARIGIPSKKGLPQIGQSIEGFKDLLGTRSSSAGAARISHRDRVLKPETVREASFFKFEHQRRNIIIFTGVDFSLTIQKPLTNPLHLFRRRLRIRDQKLYHAIQWPFPIPIRSHPLECFSERSVGGRDITRYWQCITV